MRILALTSDPSLEVALGMIEDWEVVGIADLSEAGSARGDVLLIGVGGTESGLATASEARQSGLHIPLVVVGDEDGPPDAEAAVVPRPFSLEDLRAAVDAAIAPAVPDEPEPAAEPEESEAPASEASATGPSRAAGAERVQAEAVTEPESDEEDEGLEGVDLAEVRPLPRPSSAGGDETTEAESSALRLVRHPEPDKDPVEPDEPADAAEARSASPAEVPPERPSVAVAPEPQEPAADRAPRAAPAAASPPTPMPEPGTAVRTEPSSASAAPEQKQKRRRGRRQKRGDLPAVKDPLGGKLVKAASAVGLIEEVLDELPMLADVDSLAEALVGEVVDRFKPETAALYLRGSDEFTVSAGSSLSQAEMKLKVPSTHPLVDELIRGGEALLIAPVDLARGMVSGIAGARTEALLAAPIAVGGTVNAFVVIGRDEFSDEDLDDCEMLAREAAAGLTLARLLAALAERRA